MRLLPSPNMSENPTAQKAMLVTQKTMTFFDKMLTAFFERQRPDSTMANPAFIKKTKAAVIRTQTVSAITLKSGPPFSWAKPRPGSNSKTHMTIRQIACSFFISYLLVLFSFPVTMGPPLLGKWVRKPKAIKPAMIHPSNFRFI